MHYAQSATLTELSGIAVRTDNVTALTTVVVTMLDENEKLVSMIAYIMKNKIGMFAVKGCNVAVNHSEIPTSLFVRHEPSYVAAPVIRIDPHNIPFEVTSLKFMILSPLSISMNRIMHPRSGGIAVV